MGQVEAAVLAIGTIIVCGGFLAGFALYLVGHSDKNAERERAEADRQLDEHTKML